MGEWLSSLSWLELAGVSSAFFVGLTLLGVAMGVAAERTSRRRIWDVKLKRGQLQKEILGNAVFHASFVPAFVLAVGAGLLVLRDDVTWWSEVVTFLVCWGAFQHLYYPMHRAMHHPKLFFMHRWHHESLVTTPWSGLSMGPFEAVGWVVLMLGPAILLTQVFELGTWGFVTFILMHWIGNIAGHANAEFLPRSFAARGPTWMTATIFYHAMHHARFDGHYGFATALEDRLFGTEYEDWSRLHAKVCDGTPLSSLRERG